MFTKLCVFFVKKVLGGREKIEVAKLSRVGDGKLAKLCEAFVKNGKTLRPLCVEFLFFAYFS
jgi:hypothetical protein